MFDDIYIILIAFLGGCWYIERGLSNLGKNIKEGLISLGKEISKNENTSNSDDKKTISMPKNS